LLKFNHNIWKTIWLIVNEKQDQKSVKSKDEKKRTEDFDTLKLLNEAEKHIGNTNTPVKQMMKE